MDKYLIILDITQHPEKYTEEEVRDILSDKESMDFFNSLCDADNAFTSIASPTENEINREWETLTRKSKTSVKKRTVGMFSFFTYRVATVTVIILSSIVALAIGFVMLSSSNSKSRPSIAQSSQKTEVRATEARNDSNIVADKVQVKAEIIIFENETLGKILSEVARQYDMHIHMKNNKTGKLRLFYRWDTSWTPEEVVSQLNNFEKINMIISGDTIKVN